MKPNTPTPEARQYKNVAGNPVTLDWLVKNEPEWAVNQIRHRDKLERERDEARNTCIEIDMSHRKLEAERDQLMKVCDTLKQRLHLHHESWGECDGCPDCDAFHAYNQLPHVKDKTK